MGVKEDLALLNVVGENIQETSVCTTKVYHTQNWNTSYMSDGAHLFTGTDNY